MLFVLFNLFFPNMILFAMLFPVLVLLPGEDGVPWSTEAKRATVLHTGAGLRGAG